MNSYYCPLPFKHVFVESRGVKPCCSYTFLRPGTITDWLDSEELKILQQDILSNKISSGCASCIANEQNDGTSTRLGAIQDYENKLFTVTNVDYIDYRPSNICNFRCRSCEPFFSNGIAAEVRNHPDLKKFQPISSFNQHSDDTVIRVALDPNKKVESVSDLDYHWIINNIKNIRRLMFTGGEPTKIPQVREIIDYIVQHQIDVNILITSNASFADIYWSNITKKLKNIHWTLSLDAVGRSAEIIRDGTDWELVSQNIETMFDISPSVNIGTVVTNLSVFGLSDLFSWVNNLARKYHHRPNGRTQLIALCNYPKRMSPYNWPSNLKLTVLEYLRSIDTNTLVDQQPGIISSLIDNIARWEFDSILWNESEEYNNILDQLRNQDHQQLYNPNYGI